MANLSCELRQRPLATQSRVRTAVGEPIDRSAIPLRHDGASPVFGEHYTSCHHLVTQLGGIGIAIQVDHLDAEQVRALAERVRNDLGHIEVLVNDIWGAEHLKGGPADWNTPIWEHDLDKGLRILCLAIETHLITSHHLLPLMIDEPDVSSSRSPTERLTTTLRTIGSRCSTTSPRWR